jgi:hypothetical protein
LRVFFVDLRKIEMKHLKKIILISLIISFYFIQISYNGTPSDYLGSGLINAFKTGFLIEIYSTYLFINICFMIWFSKSQKLYSILFVLIPLTIWLFWKIEFYGIIETDMYLNSSIPFLIFSFLAVIFTFWSSKNKSH